MDISIIIVNFNTVGFVKKCIESILKHSKGFLYEVIVVDNCSTLEDVDILLQCFPWITLIKNNENLGFAKANNIGIQCSKGKFVLLLNGDTTFIENSIKKCLEYYPKLKKVGFLSIKTLNDDLTHQNCCYRFPTFGNQIRQLLFEKFQNKRKLYKNQNKNFYCDVVFGHFLFFEKERINDFPQRKLNEKYFMYFEDFLWCWEMHKYGYRNFLYCDTQIIHIGKGSQINNLISESMNQQFNKNCADFFDTLTSRCEKKIIYLIRKIILFWKKPVQ